MSIRLMTAVWDSGRYDGGTLLTLLALCDWAHDDGTHVFPRIPTLARKARLSDRQVQRVLIKLKADGIVGVVAQATGKPGQATEYRINVKLLRQWQSEAHGDRDKTNDHPSETSDRRSKSEATISTGDISSGAEGSSDITDATPNAGEGDGCQNVDAEKTGDIAGPTCPETDDVDGGETGDIREVSPIPPSRDNHHPVITIEPSHPSCARDGDEMPSFLRRVWPDGLQDFMKAGTWHLSSSVTQVEDEWRGMRDAPPWPYLAGAAKTYFARLADVNGRRRKDDPTPAVSAQRFIRDRMWNDHPPMEKQTKAPELPLPPPAWGGHPVAQLLRIELGAGVFDQWLLPLRLEIADGVVKLHAKRRLTRDYVMSNFLARVERAFEAHVGYPVFVVVQLVEADAA